MKEVELNEFKKEIRNYMVDELGHYVESLGGKLLLGRIWGLLVTSNGPISMKEIAEKLHVSKPAISSAMTTGLQFEIFKKVYIKEYPRENFYQLRTHSFEMMINPGKRKFELLSQKFERGLDLIEKKKNEFEFDEEMKSMEGHMRYLKNCFTIFLEEYNAMADKVIKRIDKFKI